MTSYVIPSRRITQRSGVVCANPFWLARGLTHLATGSLAYDAAIGSLTAYTNTSDTPKIAASVFGLGRTQSGAGSFNTTRNVFTNGNFVAIWVGVLPASSSAASYAVSQSGADALIAFGGNFDDQFQSASGRLSLTCLDVGTNRSHAYVAGAVDGNPHVYLMRRSGPTVSAWIDGVSRTVVSSGGFPTPVSGYTSSTDTFRVCGNNLGGGNFVGILNMTAVLNGTFSDAECAALSSAIGFYNLYARDSRRVYFGAGAGGGTTDETSTATDAPSATASMGMSGAETGNAADAPSAIQTTARSVAETASAADSPSATTTSAGAGTTDETSTATDSPSAIQTSARTTAETGSAAETTDGTVTAAGAGVCAETASATDAPTCVIVTAGLIAEGTASAADVAAAAAIWAAVTVTETGSAVDTSTAGVGTQTVAASTAETAVAADAIVATFLPDEVRAASRSISTAAGRIGSSSVNGDGARIGSASVSTKPPRL